MSLPDTIFILLGALILFGPKKLPEIARQAGKLLGELRRASNEFKFQIEEELRASDDAERRRKAAANSAANPASVMTPLPQPPMPKAPEDHTPVSRATESAAEQTIVQPDGFIADPQPPQPEVQTNPQLEPQRQPEPATHG